jgi:hypothetical protein
MEDESLTSIPEKIGDDSVNTITKEMDTMNSNPKTISSRQRDHLAYARDCKKLKQVTRDSERQIQNSNLDFIYRRLTNIENQMSSLASRPEPIQYAVTQPVATPVVVGTKRKPPITEAMLKAEEPSPKKSKTESIKADSDSMSSYVSDSIKYYAIRGALVFSAGLIMSLGKQYFVKPRQTTQDGDHIGNYYIGPDN